MSLRRTVTNLGLDLALHPDHDGVALNHNQEPPAPPPSTKPGQSHHDFLHGEKPRDVGRVVKPQRAHACSSYHSSAQVRAAATTSQPLPP